MTPTTDSDRAAVALARVYADAIDAGDDGAVKDLGPKLLAVLDALGMTPLARSTIKRGTSGGPSTGPDGETELQRRRRAKRERRSREHHAADMDPAAGGADA